MPGKTPPHRPAPPHRSAPATVPPARVPADRLARSAMVVGVVAFLGGWLPVLGLILGVAGVILGILAKRRSNRPELGLAAVVVSTLAVLTNLVVDVLVITSIVTQYNNLPA